MYSKKNRKQNDILHCVKNRKFIRLEKLDRFARRMRYFLLFTISFSFVRFIFRYITVLRVFSLPILRSTPFISRNQSYAQCCYRISKFLEEDGDSRRRQRNEDERLNMIPLAPSENTVESDDTYRENKIYSVQNALRNAPDVFRDESSIAVGYPFFFAEFSFRIQQERGEKAIRRATRSGHIDLGASTLQAMNSEKLVGVQ